MLAFEVSPDTKDLVFSGGSPRQVNGPLKLTQDIRWAIVEKQGIDFMHPQWGSKIAELVGDLIQPEIAVSIIYMEAVNAIRKYHGQILGTLEQAKFSGIPNQFSSFVAASYGELIREIADVSVEPLSSSDPRQLRFSVTVTTETNEIVLTEAVLRA